MKKYYSLIIDEEIVPFDCVEIDPKTHLPLSPFDEMYETMFTSNPTFMDITNLDYDPIIGSVWDGKIFNHTNGVEKIEYDRSKFTRIGFMSGDVYLGRIMFNQSDRALMLIAALLSNPKIVLDRVE